MDDAALNSQDRYYATVLRDKYARFEERNADDVFARVARALAEGEKPAERVRWAAAFHDAMRGGFYPAGRIMSGAGAGFDATLVNCFVQPVGDSISLRDGRVGIYDALKQAAETMRRGGGVGYDFSPIRPRGARVHATGSRASGPVSYMHVFDRSCETVESAGARRGAQMGVLRIDHPDIEEFIRAKDIRTQAARLRAAGLAGAELDDILGAIRTLSNFNLSVAVTDAFMRLKDEGGELELVHEAEPDPREHPHARQRRDGLWVYRTVRADRLWDDLLRMTYETADPGVIFIDRMNAENNLAYCERIRGTNPCVTADSWINTSDGPRLVSELIGCAFDAVVDGRIYRSTAEGFFVTGTKAVVELRTEEGQKLKLTGDHQLLAISALTRYVRRTEWKPASELRPGDRIVLNDHRAKCEWPGPHRSEHGYLLGLLIGDGYLKDDEAVLAVWPRRKAVGDELPDGADGIMGEAMRCVGIWRHRADFRGWSSVAGGTQFRLKSAALRDFAHSMGMSYGNKRITPLMERDSSAFCSGLLRGLFDTDGSVQGSQTKGVSLRLTQVDLGNLEAVQRILLRMGIVSVIYKERRPSGMRRLPDGKGGHALYPTQAYHELVIAGENVGRFAAFIGFSDTAKSRKLHTLLLAYKRRLNRAQFLATIREIAPGGSETVFDAVIPGVNAFDANGLYVHNCGEQPLPPYGCCCLGSVDLARFVEAPLTPNARLDRERLAQLVPIAVRMLDNVLDVTNWPLPEQAREATEKRRIGLGFTGLGSALALLGVRYGTEGAAALAADIAGLLRDHAYAASVELARERGAFPRLDRGKYLESSFAKRLPDAVRDGIRHHGIRNSHLLSIAPTGTISLAFGRNVTGGIEPAFAWEYTRRTRTPSGEFAETRIQDYVYRLFLERGGRADALPAHFVNAQMLTPEEHLRMQAAVQPFIDASISKTVNIPWDYSFEKFREVYDQAFEWGCKGCTTYRPNDVTGAVLSVCDIRAPAGGPPPEGAAECMDRE